MAEVFYLPGTAIPAAQVLDAAAKLDPPLDTVMVIGKTQTGQLYMASTTDAAGEVVLLLLRGQRYFMNLIAAEAGDECG